MNNTMKVKIVKGNKVKDHMDKEERKVHKDFRKERKQKKDRWQMIAA